MMQTSCDVFHSLFERVSHSPDTNLGPLSETISTGSPYEEKRYLKSPIVLSDVVEVITTIHFEYAFTTIRNMPCIKSPA